MTTTPINISQLVTGDVVRIQLVGGFILMPVQRGVAEIVANQRPYPYRRSSMVGFVISNSFSTRQMQIDFVDLTQHTEHFLVTVPYARIRVIDKQIEGTYVSDNVHRLRIPAYVPVLGVF